MYTYQQNGSMCFTAFLWGLNENDMCKVLTTEFLACNKYSINFSYNHWKITGIYQQNNWIDNCTFMLNTV